MGSAAGNVMGQLVEGCKFEPRNTTNRWYGFNTEWRMIWKHFNFVLNKFEVLCNRNIEIKSYYCTGKILLLLPITIDHLVTPTARIFRMQRQKNRICRYSSQGSCSVSNICRFRCCAIRDAKETRATHLLNRTNSLAHVQMDRCRITFRSSLH